MSTSNLKKAKKRKGSINLKKILLLLFVVLLTACNGNSSEEVSATKQNEMTKEDALEYLYQITYRYAEAVDQEDGSFEQRSSLQAAKKREETILEELKEKYEDDLPILEYFHDIATSVRLGAESGLEESFILMEIQFEFIEEYAYDMSQEFLDGELPEPFK